MHAQLCSHAQVPASTRLQNVFRLLKGTLHRIHPPHFPLRLPPRCTSFPIPSRGWPRRIPHSCIMLLCSRPHSPSQSVAILPSFLHPHLLRLNEPLAFRMMGSLSIPRRSFRMQTSFRKAFRILNESVFRRPGFEFGRTPRIRNARAHSEEFSFRMRSHTRTAGCRPLV